MTAILGISAFFHDAAAALVVDGQIVAAAQEERFSRIKNDASYPREAIAFCLTKGELTLNDLDAIVFYEKPFLKFERLLDTTLAFAPRGRRAFVQAMPVWIKEKLFLKSGLLDWFHEQDPAFKDRGQLRFCDHHQSHCASAFYPSPFDQALVLSIDGVGERATTTVAVGHGAELEIKRELQFPHSLGLLYSAFTQYLGFRVNSDEYKVMGLAPYGTPRYADLIAGTLLHIAPDGSFWLDQHYFDYCAGQTMTHPRFHTLFGGPPRAPDAPLTQDHMDIAASVQEVCRRIVVQMATALRQDFDLPNLCLAGGFAQNSVINGHLARSGLFEKIWVQPCPGDAGGALGAALAYWHQGCGGGRRATTDTMRGARLGPDYGQAEIAQRLAACGAAVTVLPDNHLFDQVANWLDQGKVIGWFDGALEFGPRALGGRSILADPRAPDMQARVNQAIKNREGFRPFAPAVLAEHAADWFDLDCDSPYMAMVASLRADKLHRLSPAEEALKGFQKLSARRSDIPAVTHVDGTARIQTVAVDQSPRFHAQIRAFHARTGCPMVLNTSFNGRDEPIVCTPEEALACFRATDMDILVCGPCVVAKQDKDLDAVRHLD